MKTKTSSRPDFINDLRRVSRDKSSYGFERRQDSLTLARLHGCRELLQAVLSQAGSYMLTGKFHDDWTFTIGKAEGGFWIPSHGEFVPTPSCVVMDNYNPRVFSKTAAEASEKLTGLVTHIVLNWNPVRHEDSLYEVAAAYAGTTAADLRAAVEGNGNYRTTLECLSRGMCGPGNPISYFFGWNKFDEIPYDAAYRDFWLKSSGRHSPAQA